MVVQVAALVLLTSVYYGAMYGGRISSILLNIPGDEPAMMTCLDGHPMAMKGKAPEALAISGIASFVGAVTATIGLMLFAPMLVRVAIHFGPAEYFALFVLAFVTIGGVTISFSDLLVALVIYVRKQREQTLRAQELLRIGQVGRLNALGEMAAGLAHELNQPLTSVLANTQASLRLLQDDPPDLEPAREAMAHSVEQIKRAASVLTRLRHSLRESGLAEQCCPVSLTRVLGEAVHLLMPELERHGITLEKRLPPHDVVVVGEGDVVVDPLEDRAEVRRLDLVRVGQPEAGPLGHGERHLHPGRELGMRRGANHAVFRAVGIDARQAEDAPRNPRNERAGLEPVPPHPQHDDHVTQVQTVFREGAEPLRGVGVGLHEDLLQEAVAVESVHPAGLPVRAELEPVVPVELPVYVQPPDEPPLAEQ